jgi:hypothetical protein
MATTIITQNSLTPSATPTNLQAGQLAVNVADAKLWVGDGINPIPLIVSGGGAAVAAVDVTYDNSGSDLVATNAQDAFDEVDVDINNAEASITINAGNITNLENTKLDIGTPAEDSELWGGYAIQVDNGSPSGTDPSTVYFVV